jgi:hypothetical protein
LARLRWPIPSRSVHDASCDQTQGWWRRLLIHFEQLGKGRRRLRHRPWAMAIRHCTSVRSTRSKARHETREMYGGPSNSHDAAISKRTLRSAVSRRVAFAQIAVINEVPISGFRTSVLPYSCSGPIYAASSDFVR